MTRRQKLWWRKNKIIPITVGISFWLGLFASDRIMTYFYTVQTDPGPIVSPIPEPTSPPKPPQSLVYGKASYYSVDECLGCRGDRLMANGEVLDDAVPTVAINSLPLNSVVKITNINNGRNILVRVTDTGGFEKYGRVADLSLAAKTYLECEDLCDVSIEKLTLDNHNTNTLQ